MSSKSHGYNRFRIKELGVKGDFNARFGDESKL